MDTYIAHRLVIARSITEYSMFEADMRTDNDAYNQRWLDTYPRHNFFIVQGDVVIAACETLDEALQARRLHDG